MGLVPVEVQQLSMTTYASSATVWQCHLEMVVHRFGVFTQSEQGCPTMTEMKLRSIAIATGWVALLLVAIGIHAFGMLSDQYTCADLGSQEAYLSGGGWGNAAECVTRNGSTFNAVRRPLELTSPLWSFVLVVGVVAIPCMWLLARRLGERQQKSRTSVR